MRPPRPSVFRLVVLAACLVTLAPLRAESPSEFRLEPAEVPKVVVLMFKPSRSILEVTYSAEKQAELKTLVAAHPGRPVRISLAGVFSAERIFTAPPGGHSLKFDLPSVDEAISLARVLMGESPPPTRPIPAPSLFSPAPQDGPESSLP